MQKLILHSVIFAACIMTTITGKAKQCLQLGLQVAPQATWLMNQDDRHNRNFSGLSTVRAASGLTSRFGCTNNMSFGLDLIYSMQGQRYSLSGVEQLKQVDYLKIPVTLIYNYPIAENLKLFGMVGPQAAILAKAKLTDEKGANAVDFRKTYHNAELGAVAAAGLGINLDRSIYLDISLRYDYGFTNAENRKYNSNINGPLETINSGTGNATTRAATHNATAGLTVGLRWIFHSAPVVNNNLKPTDEK